MLDPVKDAAERANRGRFPVSRNSTHGAQTTTREAENDERGRLIEIWLTDRTITELDEQLQWKDILRQVRRQPGCDMVARQHPSGPTTGEAVVIEWKRARHREKFFASKDSSLQVFLAAAQRMEMQQQFLAKKIGYDDFPIIVADEERMPCPPLEKRMFEVLTAYFPADLPTASMRTIEKIRGPQYFPRESCRDAGEERSSSSYDGLAACHHGWALGNVGGGGHSAALRMVYILRWGDQEAREVYKRKAIWKKRSAMDSFVDDLEEWGMLGCESRTFQLQQISRWSGPA